MNPSIYPSIVPSDTWDRIIEHEFMPANGEPFSNAVGKRILCKAQGLTGAEKRMCGTQILSKCGRKKICPPLIAGKKCREYNDKWLKCAQGVQYVGLPDNTSVIPPDTSTGTDTGTGAGADEKKTIDVGANWMPYAIGGGILLLAVGAFYMIKKGKAKPVAVGK
jgi:hypothetical protein